MKEKVTKQNKNRLTGHVFFLPPFSQNLFRCSRYPNVALVIVREMFEETIQASKDTPLRVVRILDNGVQELFFPQGSVRTKAKFLHFVGIRTEWLIAPSSNQNSTRNNIELVIATL